MGHKVLHASGKGAFEQSDQRCDIKYEPRHEISNNEVCATSKASDQPAHMLGYSVGVKLLTEHHLECLSLKRLLSSSESTLVKMPHCWKSHAAAQLYIIIIIGFFLLTCMCRVIIYPVGRFPSNWLAASIADLTHDRQVPLS